MGLRNTSKYLDEILFRVLGDLIARQIVVKIADDLIIGANTIDELFLITQTFYNVYRKIIYV